MAEGELALRGPASASIAQARAWARQRTAMRTADVDSYLNELWRLASKLGYDPAIIAAQSSEATDGWTNDAWRNGLDPASLRDETGREASPVFKSGIDAARAHLVRVSAYVKGYESRLQPWIHLDRGWQRVFEAGDAARVATLRDLAAKWSERPDYEQRVIWHLAGIETAFQVPAATRQPTPGGAPLPSEIERRESGNWSVRTFGQRPVAIVFHVIGEPDAARVISWYQNPASGTSAHIVVGRDGRMTQLVSAERSAWANDDPKNPRRDIGWLNDALKAHRSNGGSMTLNDFTLAITLVGTSGQPPAEAQYRSALAMAAYWRDRFGITPDRHHLLRHSDINSVDQRGFSDSALDIERIVLVLKNLSGTEARHRGERRDGAM